MIVLHIYFSFRQMRCVCLRSTVLSLLRSEKWNDTVFLQVLEALYKNHYNLLETLEHLEEFIGPRFEPFSRAEVTAFFQGMKACNNNDFVYIRTNVSVITSMPCLVFL